MPSLQPVLGFRVGVADATGDVQYGPLLFRDAACTAIAFKDSYAYIATKVDGEAGLVRTDLSTTVIASALYFPWAWDLVAAGTSATASQVAFFGNSDRAAFSTGNNIWAESTTSLVAVVTCVLVTSATTHLRLRSTNCYKLVLIQPMAVLISSLLTQPILNTLSVSSHKVQTVPEINVNYPTTAQEYLGFKFTMSRSTTDVTKGPLFTGYQLKSLPAVPRQRLIQYPVFCYDHESDKFSNEVGYEGSAYDRMSQLDLLKMLVTLSAFKTLEPVSHT
jgi:hypothetical protein